MDKKFQYGGQALIEGVMMRGPERTAIAVRRPDGEIVVESNPHPLPKSRNKVLGWPLVRGVAVLIDSLVLGIKAMNRSAELVLDEGEELSELEIVFTVFFALLLAVFLFVVIPTVIVHLAKDWLEGVVWQNLVEGVIRVAVFLAYVVLIARLKDIKRVFMYHGAEHKVVHTLESGQELTVENARDKSCLHPRCGTSFLLLVMVVSILVFSCLGEGSIWWRIGSRLLTLPLVAGLSYELIKISSIYGSHWAAKMIAYPGLWLQKLTTGEPDDSQLEVAIKALTAVIAD